MLSTIKNILEPDWPVGYRLLCYMAPSPPPPPHTSIETWIVAHFWLVIQFYIAAYFSMLMSVWSMFNALQLNATSQRRQDSRKYQPVKPDCLFVHYRLCKDELTCGTFSGASNKLLFFNRGCAMFCFYFFSLVSQLFCITIYWLCGAENCIRNYIHYFIIIGRLAVFTCFQALC